ncbi:glycoside hydrolase family 15 protein [Falsigemmobacter faecalis]|uniref:Glycoside hydrolase family 15 protein n=1 Tax=Falsigemmobacter faecalis TaxID=2488730 RepID=A0A3P3DDD9_9RHOB|nr:glycoside hydrolase family 15 protein [Falsigemmobacter faecalis]RRH72300.1 glycoside hydrolase family 15 protein [Falsigemmobacter faecalis]
MTGPGDTDLNLALIGNAAGAALISSEGAVTFMCAPRMDGDPVFCGLLNPVSGPPEGEWQIRLTGQTRSEQRYLRNTPIVETLLHDAEGNCLRLLDFMPRYKNEGRTFRGRTLVRIVEPVSGTPRLQMRLRPRYGYGAHPATRTAGSNHIRYDLGSQVLRLSTDAPLDYVLSETPFLVGRPMAFLFGPDEGLSDDALVVAQHFLRRTRGYWQDWVRSLALPPDYQQVVIRSAITLKLCSYEDTGAIMAAITTSIPEYDGSGRTWDYRFCWLRDSYFTVQALNSLNATRTMENYLLYVSNVAAGSPDGVLQPLFGLGGEREPLEELMPDLAGYRGSGPVRRGNAAYTQVQNDGYGSVIMAVTQAFFDERLPNLGGVDLFRRMEQIGDEARRRWNEPDAGLWEFRTRSAVHTHSALMCWAGCDRLAKIARHLNLTPEADRWAAEAHEIREAILHGAWNKERGSFVSEFGGEDLDASLLLMAQTGFLRPDDPRFLATLAAVEQDLRFGDHVYRYRRPDDFGAPETAFSACTFWLIDALHRVGRQEEARQIFEGILSQRTALGLLSEGVHVETGALWGNFPQTYSMVGLINSAMALSRRWEEVL